MIGGEGDHRGDQAEADSKADAGESKSQQGWTKSGSSGSPEGRSRLRSLEEPLPALQQRLELVACMPVSREHLDVVPVFGEALLELGDGRLVCRDLCLDPLELRGVFGLADALRGFAGLRSTGSGVG